MLQRVTDRLRPGALYRAVAREGVHAVRAVYPAHLADGGEAAEPDGSWRTAAPHLLSLASAPGVITSVDDEVLVEAASAGGVTVELLRAVGEFVPRGEALLAVHGEGTVDETTLPAAVALADERTIEQDPAFAIRIIVDTAIRALSPAVNDPTTAVGSGLPPPACVLEDLRAAAPAIRHAAVDDHLARLDASVAETFAPGSPERALARVADRMGLGLARCQSPVQSAGGLHGVW
jgi:Predicted membrane protein (DUF2254)